MIKHIALLTAAALALASCNKSADKGAIPAPSAPVAAVAPPNGTDWVSTVSATADGGYVMGNPNAALKLMEFGALSCPHCAHFSKESHDELHALIATGKLSYELRTFLIHPQMDLPVSLLAACNGPATFFPMTEQFFAKQDEWMGPAKFKLLTPEVQKTWATMSPNQLAADVADRLGLITFVGVRGLTADKAKACLADKAGVDRLQKILNAANDTYHITGTPTFIINGTIVPDTNDWATLKPKLKIAMGG
jgi:protein-disulfide isomerase